MLTPEPVATLVGYQPTSTPQANPGGIRGSRQHWRLSSELHPLWPSPVCMLRSRSYPGRSGRSPPIAPRTLPAPRGDGADLALRNPLPLPTQQCLAFQFQHCSLLFRAHCRDANFSSSVPHDLGTYRQTAKPILVCDLIAVHVRCVCTTSIQNRLDRFSTARRVQQKTGLRLCPCDRRARNDSSPDCRWEPTSVDRQAAPT